MHNKLELINIRKEKLEQQNIRHYRDNPHIFNEMWQLLGENLSKVAELEEKINILEKKQTLI